MKTSSETDVMQHCITKRKSLLVKALIVKAEMVNTKIKSHLQMVAFQLERILAITHQSMPPIFINFRLQKIIVQTK
jgi:hypothetical protein